MIKFENTETYGWEAALRGMRNPLNSWEKGDSGHCTGRGAQCRNCPIEKDGLVEEYGPCYFKDYGILVIGPNDYDLMKRLRNAGADHRKYLRMIMVSVDITAPLYWWKEFDTYKVGTVANSCSTMHKIAEKEFKLEDFSYEHLINEPQCYWRNAFSSVVSELNKAREKYLETKDKKYWWQMIQLLPSSYNQKRTVTLNYEVLANIYKSRKNHKLDEWRLMSVTEAFNERPETGSFCDWIKTLPYSEFITGEFEPYVTGVDLSPEGK